MIKSLTIGHYKSYFNRQTFKFAVPDRSKNQIGLNIVVGPNNAGKSTAFNVFTKLLDGKPTITADQSARHGKQACFFRIQSSSNLSFSVSAKFQKGHGKAAKEIIGNAPFGKGKKPRFLKVVPSRRPFTDTYGSYKDYKYETFEDPAVKIAGYIAPLGELLKIIDDDPLQRSKFNQLLKRVLPSAHDWSLDRIGGKDRVTYVTPGNFSHTLDELGDGFSNVFRILATIYFSSPDDTIILDEPELSLHPQAQRRLFNLLSDVSKDRQVIVATHSIHFVEWDSLKQGARLIRISKDERGASLVTTISDKTLNDVIKIAASDKKNRRLYDALAKEVFFSDATVFVEGQEDVHILEDYISRKNRQTIPFFGYGSGGASNIKTWLTMASELKLRAVGLYDGDKDKEYKRTLKTFAKDENIKVLRLQKDDIRDKHLRDGGCTTSGSCRETATVFKEGYFDRKWKVKSKSEQELVDILEQIEAHIIG